MKRQWSAFLFFLILLASCSLKESAAQPPWDLSYSDGSGNGYHFWLKTASEEARFEYTPVRPEESSTGFYSGGSPKQGQVGRSELRKLWDWVHRLEKDRSLHVTSRDKGTGAFRVKEGDALREFIIMRSGPLERFDAFLLPFRGK